MPDRNLRRDEKGIVTIIGFVMFVILLVLYGYFSPLINEAIIKAKQNITDPLALLTIDMVQFFILLGILISWFVYAGTK